MNDTADFMENEGERKGIAFSRDSRSLIVKLSDDKDIQCRRRIDAMTSSMLDSSVAVPPPSSSPLRRRTRRQHMFFCYADRGEKTAAVNECAEKLYRKLKTRSQMVVLHKV